MVFSLMGSMVVRSRQGPGHADARRTGRRVSGFDDGGRTARCDRGHHALMSAKRAPTTSWKLTGPAYVDVSSARRHRGDEDE